MFHPTSAAIDITSRSSNPFAAYVARDVIRVFGEAMARRRERNRVARELEAYNDRELAELGLSRCDIASVAAGTHRR